MKKNVKNIIITLTILVIYLLIQTPPVLAVEKSEEPKTKVQFSVSLEGTLPSKAEEFTIKLKTDNLINPMPEGSIDGIYQITATGEETNSFPTITYSRVGIYNYTIWQEKGNNNDCTYDNSVYYLTVFVTNKENGEGLEATSVLYKDDGDKKVDEANFHNVYKTIKEEVESITDIVEDTNKPNVQTGDNSNAVFWIILSVIGATGIIYLVSSPHKKNDKSN